MTITWTIENLERNTSDGFVTTAHWQATAAIQELKAELDATKAEIAALKGMPSPRFEG